MEILLTSELSPSVPVVEVGRLFSGSRESSEAMNISGFLIFDGRRFCHFLEGDEPVIAAQAERICADLRHTNCVERFRRRHPERRRFKRWHLGYVLADDLDDCMMRADAEAFDPCASLSAFQRLFARMNDLRS